MNSPVSRIFIRADQFDFAELSGDYNPIHLDPIIARRLIFGRDVLHGLHLVLWAIDQWLAGRASPLQLKWIRAEFRRPASAGEQIVCMGREQQDDGASIELFSSGARLLSIDARFEAGRPSAIDIPPPVGQEHQPRIRTLSEVRNCCGTIPLWLDPELAARLFPNLFRLLPIQQLATLLAGTRLVGMEAPGLHSIWRSFELSESTDERLPQLSYRANRFDERFSLLDLKVRSLGLSGLISTAIRPPPSEQPPYAAIRSMVKSDRFRDERALVIGGSRGLGEAATKLLAAGGADVKLTYHRGAEDAKRVVSEITCGDGVAADFQYDVLRDASKLPSMLGDWTPTLLCYFATPFIFAGSRGQYSQELFQRFRDFYVAGFDATFRAVDGVKRVLYPSSSAIDELPPNLLEYTAAKAAGEALCRSLATAYPNTRFHVPRFFRLATDQTATLLRVPSADPSAALLAALRQLLE